MVQPTGSIWHWCARGGGTAQVMEEIIAKSKMYKAMKAKQREEDEEELEKVRGGRVVRRVMWGEMRVVVVCGEVRVVGQASGGHKRHSHSCPPPTARAAQRGVPGPREAARAEGPAQAAGPQQVRGGGRVSHAHRHAHARKALLKPQQQGTATSCLRLAGMLPWARPCMRPHQLRCPHYAHAHACTHTCTHAHA